MRARRRPIREPVVQPDRTRRPPIDLGPLRPLRPSLSLLRPDDLLALRITWVNLTLEGGKLVRGSASRAAYLIVELEPQHVAEEAYFEVNADYPVSDRDLLDYQKPPSTPLKKGDTARARIAGRSRLAFRVPPSVPEIPCTLAGILDACSDLQLSVTATAAPPPAPVKTKAGKKTKKPVARGKVQKPTPEQTAIEAPWRLELSPNALCAWLHARDIVAGISSERVELWHTRLGTRDAATIHDGRYPHVRGADGEWAVTKIRDAPVEHNRTVRAVWSPDHVDVGPVEGPKNKPFRMSLNPNDRHQLVGLTADPKVGGWQARVVRSRRLMLSSLGAWLDLDYVTGGELPPEGFSVEAWRHLAASGRDNYVRVVYAGHLCGLPNRASLVKVTERKFGRRAGVATDDALLRQRMYVIVREPEVTFTADRRRMPFRRIRLTTLVTPNLDPPEDPGVQIDTFGQRAMWLTVNGEPFLFHGVAWDWEGRPSDFAIPLVFVEATLVNDAVKTVVDAYNTREGADQKLRRSVPFHGQQVAFAENRGDAGSTTLEAASIEFLAEYKASLPRPFFLPVVESAHVRVPAVEQLVGHSAQPVKITIDDDYVKSGWPKTPKGDVFARIADPGGMLMEFGADRSGGVATPSLNVGGLSRRFGPVGGSAASVKIFNTNGTFDPQQYFGGIEAKILGGIDLLRIVKGTFGDTTVPRLMSKPVLGPAGPTAIETTLDWTPQIDEFGPFKPKDKAHGLKLEARVRTDLASGASVSIVHGELKDFDMNLFGFVVLPFKELTFDANSNQKTHVSADLGEVTFGGPLAFVNELKDYLGGDGFKDPPSIDVTSEGVRVGFSLELPSIAVGVMTLQNISFGAALNLPFTGDPVRFRFNFCEREHPFHLLIYCFGGGGSFAIAIGLDGVEQIEAQLEFGAAISIDVGVASGGVHLMAGIYYSWKEAEKSAWLEGYLRMGGELDVLGIVSMSLEFVMSLAYDSGPNIVWGEATLTVEIEVAFFSESVEMSVRRELGDPDRPLIEDMFTADDWSAYWGAFAKAA